MVNAILGTIFGDIVGSVFGCEIIVLDDKEDVSDAEELTRDLMALLASFSGKYYGRRSLERRKQNKNDNTSIQTKVEE